MSAGAYDAICLSPHLDDAVLSCGGWIHDRIAAGETVLVVTVAAGDEPPGVSSPILRSLHRAWRLHRPEGAAGERVVARRRAEDADACAALGADWLHWDLREAMYRRSAGAGEPFYRTLEDLFGPIPPGDRPTVLQVIRRLEELPAHDRIYAPLAVGGHVDHRIVRAAAEQRYGAVLGHYQEYPYGRRTRAVEPLVRGAGWVPERRTVSREGAAAKVRAVAAYRSQVGPMFGGRRRMERRVRRDLRRAGETIWWWKG